MRRSKRDGKSLAAGLNAISNGKRQGKLNVVIFTSTRWRASYLASVGLFQKQSSGADGPAQ